MGKRGSMLPQIPLYQKKLHIKVVQNWISYKKIRERICLSPPGLELGGYLHFCTLLDFKHIDLCSPLAPFLGEINICAQKIFLHGNSILNNFIWSIFWYNRIFGTVEHQSEPTFLYIIKFRIHWSVELPSSTPGEDSELMLYFPVTIYSV